MGLSVLGGWPDGPGDIVHGPVAEGARADEAARRLHHQRVALAQAHGQAPPPSSRLYEEFPYAAQSWAQPWRVVLKTEVMRAGDNPRFVVMGSIRSF